MRQRPSAKPDSPPPPPDPTQACDKVETRCGRVPDDPVHTDVIRAGFHEHVPRRGQPEPRLSSEEIEANAKAAAEELVKQWLSADTAVTDIAQTIVKAFTRRDK